MKIYEETFSGTKPFIEAGYPSDGKFYRIQDGSVEVRIQKSPGAVTTFEMHKGQFVGLVGPLLGAKRSASVVPKGTVRLEVYDVRNDQDWSKLLQHLAQHAPEDLLEMLRDLAGAVHGSADQARPTRKFWL